MLYPGPTAHLTFLRAQHPDLTGGIGLGLKALQCQLQRQRITLRIKNRDHNARPMRPSLDALGQ
ncbi:hypothetical protein D3C76_1819050 [compost metagenome]